MMANYKFGDKVITPEGKGTVEEDQLSDSNEVKVQLQGEDAFRIFSADQLTHDIDKDYGQS